MVCVDVCVDVCVPLSQVILYQDNELPQLFSLESVEEQLKEYGYNLLKVTMDHYLVYSNFINIKVAN